MAFQTYRREKMDAVSESWSSFDMGVAFLDKTIDELRRLARGLQPIEDEVVGVSWCLGRNVGP